MFSFLQYVPIIQINQSFYLDYLGASYVNLQDAPIDSFENHLVSQDEQFMPDLISFNAYGSEEYWRLICLYNGIIDPTVDLVMGLQIRIPDLSSMLRYLSTANHSTPTNNTIQSRTPIILGSNIKSSPIFAFDLQNSVFAGFDSGSFT